jgi:hypothetical protein
MSDLPSLGASQGVTEPSILRGGLRRVGSGSQVMMGSLGTAGGGTPLGSMGTLPATPGAGVRLTPLPRPELGHGRGGVGTSTADVSWGGGGGDGDGWWLEACDWQQQEEEQEQQQQQQHEQQGSSSKPWPPNHTVDSRRSANNSSSATTHP